MIKKATFELFQVNFFCLSICEIHLKEEPLGYKKAFQSWAFVKTCFEVIGRALVETEKMYLEIYYQKGKIK